MKKIILSLILLAGVLSVHAQGYALIDSEYILSRIPSYETLTKELKGKAEVYTKEIQALQKEAQQLYADFQRDLPRLDAKARTERENIIVAKEQQQAKLQQKYFGPEGEMAKLQKEKLEPIRDAIYEAVKLISSKRGYDLVLDRATAAGVIFASPQADISNDVLTVLGVKK